MAARKKVSGSAANATAKELPEVEEVKKELPETAKTDKPTPKKTEEKKEMPEVQKFKHPENTVLFGNTPIEIKSTKVGYQRSNLAAFYLVLEQIPLPELFVTELPGWGDGDTALFNWLVAVTDDEELVKREYNNLDTDTIEEILKIYKRVNRIDEKRENLKKQGSQKAVR